MCLFVRAEWELTPALPDKTQGRPSARSLCVLTTISLGVQRVSGKDRGFCNGVFLAKIVIRFGLYKNEIQLSWTVLLIVASHISEKCKLVNVIFSPFSNKCFVGKYKLISCEVNV